MNNLGYNEIIGAKVWNLRSNIAQTANLLQRLIQDAFLQNAERIYLWVIGGNTANIIEGTDKLLPKNK